MIGILHSFIAGTLLAIGRILPGVSLQTAAVVSGTYNEIVSFLFRLSAYGKAVVLYLFARRTRQETVVAFHAVPWQFGLPVVVGATVVLTLTTKVVPNIYADYATQISAVAFGVVIASLIIPFQEMQQKTWDKYLLVVITAASFWLLFGVHAPITSTSPALYSFFIGGILTAGASLLPGVPVVFPSIALGIYPLLLKTLNSLRTVENALYSFSALLLFGVGYVLGLLIFIKLITHTMERYKSHFLAFVAGLLLASIRLVWPFLVNGRAVAPWQITLTVFTQQIILVSVSFTLVTAIRKLMARKPTFGTSFGDTERTVITS